MILKSEKKSPTDYNFDRMSQTSGKVINSIENSQSKKINKFIR